MCICLCSSIFVKGVECWSMPVTFWLAAGLVEWFRASFGVSWVPGSVLAGEGTGSAVCLYSSKTQVISKLPV